MFNYNILLSIKKIKIEDQTVFDFLEGVSCDIPEIVKHLLPTLSERKGKLILIRQDSFNILNAIFETNL